MTTKGLSEEAQGSAVGSGMPPTVFLADPSAEAERIAQMLRNAGYLVADVPLSMLYSRIAVQKPHVVLLDVDMEGALAEVRRVRELPESGAIDFVFFGNTSGVIGSADEALDHDASGFFARPVDLNGLLTKLRVLTGGPEWRGAAFRQLSTPPPSIPAARPSGQLPIRDSSLPPPPRDKPPSVLPPPPADLPSGSAAPAPSAASMVEDPARAAAMLGPVSPELQRLLEDAEKRIVGLETMEAAVTPEEELEAVLPVEVLAALDEPLDDDSIDESAPEIAMSVGPRSALQHFQPTSVGRSRRPGSEPPHTQTDGGSASSTTGSRGLEGTPQPGGSSHVASRPGSVAPSTASLPHGSNAPGTAPGTGAGGGTGAGNTGAGTGSGVSSSSASFPGGSSPGRNPGSYSGAGSYPGATTGAGTSHASNIPTEARPPAIGESRPPSLSSRMPTGRAPAPSPSTLPQPPKNAKAQVLAGPIDFARAIGSQISERKSGALCLDGGDGLRRVVFHEGDFVTAASSRDEESLVSFLVRRGDLPRAEGTRLAGKVPPFGRHAGAALIAHGHLSQDQLWSVLRAHAEWIILRAMKVTQGSVIAETEAPGRLKGEPSVFGGTTGAAVFVDVVRRAYSAEEALAALGGAEARLVEGGRSQLASEVGLDPREERLIMDARNGTISQLLARSPEPDIVTLALGLSLLGVLEAIAAARRPSEGDSAAHDDEIRALDEEAVLARVRARLQLVDEGDYFAVLGVARDATGYEIRRAFLDLRRAFEPARLLTPRLAHLVPDVKKITIVLEEAYEILKDTARRERYRRAIDASPDT